MFHYKQNRNLKVTKKYLQNQSLKSFFFNIFIDYAITVVPFPPLTPLHPAYPLPPTFPPYSSCPWVILISSELQEFQCIWTIVADTKKKIMYIRVNYHCLLITWLPLGFWIWIRKNFVPIRHKDSIAVWAHVTCRQASQRNQSYLNPFSLNLRSFVRFQ